MSKTHSLDIKTAYQASLIITIIASVVIMGINAWYVTKALTKSAAQPALRAREQQLQQAITLTSPKSPEN